MMKSLFIAIVLATGCSKPCPKAPQEPVCREVDTEGGIRMWECSFKGVDYVCIRGLDYHCWESARTPFGYTVTPPEYWGNQKTPSAKHVPGAGRP